MSVSERQKTILDTIIREYVESARPVSSQYLGEKYDFGICPASIRIEMQKLADDGFLTQPHTSAGRIPTDKGYRFFVDEVMENGVPPVAGKLDFAPRAAEEEFEDVFKFANAITRSLAGASSSLVLGYLRQEDLLWKEGWEDLLQNPEFGQRRMIDDFIGYLDYLEEGVRCRQSAPQIDIHIGKENRFAKSEEFAAITFSLNYVDGEETVISIAGPKRMAYDKNIGLINETMRIFENI